MCFILYVSGFQSLRDGDTFPRNIRQKAPVDSSKVQVFISHNIKMRSISRSQHSRSFRVAEKTANQRSCYKNYHRGTNLNCNTEHTLAYL